MFHRHFFIIVFIYKLVVMTIENTFHFCMSSMVFIHTLTHVRVIIFSIHTYICMCISSFLHNRDYIQTHCNNRRNTFHFCI